MTAYMGLAAEQLGKFPIYKRTVCDMEKLDTRALYETALYELGWAQAPERV